VTRKVAKQNIVYCVVKLIRCRILMPVCHAHLAPKVRNGDGVTDLQYGHGFTETDTDERKRNAGNQALDEQAKWTTLCLSVM